MLFLSVQGRGAVFTICIFFFCVIIVHIARLALAGWRAFKKREPKKQEKTAPPEPEPVYYIVEKKKKTAPQYKKPRKFKFQK